MLAVEKRRRRRESHNAVERRRRDNINERIAELATLIPESMLDPNGNLPSSPPVTSEKFISGFSSGDPQNRGRILVWDYWYKWPLEPSRQ